MKNKTNAKMHLQLSISYFFFEAGVFSGLHFYFLGKNLQCCNQIRIVFITLKRKYQNLKCVRVWKEVFFSVKGI